jgi:hypothetical protein
LTPQKWTFFVRQKCPFWPLRAANFKNEMQNIKIWGCDHYALISVFSCKKTVTDFFGVAAGGQFGGSKMDIFV